MIMGEKQECKIVQDLLPNYIENLLNSETKEYVEKHLKVCEECKDTLQNMKENVNITDNKASDKEVNYLKKFKKKMKLLRSIILIIILIFVVVMGRRVIIATYLYNKAKVVQGSNPNNYYMRMEGLSNGTHTINERYYKDGNYIVKLIHYKEGEGRTEVIFHKNGEENIMLTHNNQGEKYIAQNVSTIGITTTSYTLQEYILLALSYGIEYEKLDEVECYVLKDKYREIYIEKETGLRKKEIDKANNIVTDYYYEYGTVQDADIKLPDTSEYVSVEP